MAEISTKARVVALSGALVFAGSVALVLTSCDGRQQQGLQQGQQPVPQNGTAPNGQVPPSGSGQNTDPSGNGAVGGSITPGNGAAGDDDAAAATGLSKDELAQGKAYVNGWDGLADQIPDTVNWTVSNIAVTTPPPNVPGSGGSAGSGVSYQNGISTLLSDNCTSCHRAGGSQASTPMTTYAEVKTQGAAIVARVTAGTMPPAGALPQATKDKFTAWQAAGFPEAGGASTTTTTIPTNTGTTTTGNTGATTDANGGVTFRIAKGTGQGAWNTQQTEVVAKVGKPFTIVNEDDIVHQWHTNGAPCEHGDEIQPGQSATCTPSAPYNDGALYDHISRGPFYIRAE